MPNNRVIYVGIVILVATVLIWIGAELAKRIEWVLPYAAAAGVALIVIGFIYEFWKNRTASKQPHPFETQDDTKEP